MVRGVFVRGFCLEGFVRGSFCPFPFLSEYLRFNRKLNITFNLTFHMHDKKIKKCDVTCSWTPIPLSQTSHFLGPSGPSSVTYFMDGPFPLFQLLPDYLIANPLSSAWSLFFLVSSFLPLESSFCAPSVGTNTQIYTSVLGCQMPCTILFFILGDMLRVFHIRFNLPNIADVRPILRFISLVH